MNEDYDEARTRKLHDEQRAEITRLQYREHQHTEHIRRLEEELKQAKGTLFAAQQELLTTGQELLKYQWESDQHQIYVINMHEREAAIRQHWYKLTQEEMLKYEDVPFLLWLIDSIRFENAEGKESVSHRVLEDLQAKDEVITRFQATHNTILHALDIAVTQLEHAPPTSWDNGVTDSNNQGDQGRYRAWETILNLRQQVTHFQNSGQRL